MKSIFVVSLLFLINISSVFADELAARAPIAWQNLESGLSYTLLQDIVWPVGPRPVYPRFERGSRFSFVSAEGLGSVPVILVRVQAARCPDPTARAEMMLVQPVTVPVDPANDRRVGVALETHCIVEIFVENKDYSQLSFLSQ